jgi:hypothetical protein
MPVDPRVLERVLEAFATATGGDPVAVQDTQRDRAIMRSADGHLLVLTTGELPLRPDLDTDDLALLVELCNAWLRIGEAFRSTGANITTGLADAAVIHAREKLRHAL